MAKGSFRSTLRTGREAIQAALESTGGGGKFTPVHVFESGETKYLQFLEPIDDWPEILMHQFIIVGHRDDGSEIYERFISRKDPNIDGPDGYDELVDRFGEKPTRRVIALAVEMTPVTETKAGRKTVTGYEVAYRQYENSEGETVTVPNIALVIESPYTLFKHIDAVADIGPVEDMIISIKVTGRGKDKTFTPLPTGFEAIDLSEVDGIEEWFEEFDFDAYLEELASEERMKELIGPLPDDWVVNKFSKKGKKDEKPSGRRRPVKDDPEVEEEVEEEPSPRQARFADLKAKAKERAAKAES